METSYQMRKAETREMLPEIDLLPSILHEGNQLDVALFGPDMYKTNVKNMLKTYFHSKELSNITFSPATTAESISAAAYNFTEFAKPKIFNPNWLQAGRIFKAPEWVVVNTLKDEQGDLIEDERTLKRFLNEAKKVNGIYRIPNGKIKGVRDCSFVPYESFKQKVQSDEDFARSGIARGLEYVEGDIAPNLKIISSKTNYPREVNVFGFSPESVSRIVGLDSYRGLDDHGLSVLGDYWDGYYDGFAFGVLDKSAEGASQKNK